LKKEGDARGEEKNKFKRENLKSEGKIEMPTL